MGDDEKSCDSIDCMRLEKGLDGWRTAEMSTNDGGDCSAVGCSGDYATNSIGCVRPMTCNSRCSMRYLVSLL